MDQELSWKAPRSTPKRRSGSKLVGMILVTFGLYYGYWVHRLHVETPTRRGMDSSGRGLILLPILVGILSTVPVAASGIFGGGDVDMRLFLGGMGVNLLAHLLYLRASWQLTARMAALTEASGRDPKPLVNTRRDIAIGLLAIAVENMVLKSISLLKLDVPGWVDRVDTILLGVGAVGFWSWSRHCLRAANILASDQKRVLEALGVEA